MIDLEGIEKMIFGCSTKSGEWKRKFENRFDWHQTKKTLFTKMKTFFRTIKEFGSFIVENTFVF